MTKFDYARYFFSVDKFLETSDGKRSLTLCHYPMLSWKHAKRSYMIHGHIHNDTRADFWPLIAARENVLNAGVDINSFKPVTFDELLETTAISRKTLWRKAIPEMKRAAYSDWE